MATRTWTGASGDGSFSTAGNWSAAVVPVTGDSVIVSATASTGITAGLDHSADGAGAGLNIVSFTIQEGFAYNIGSSSAPLKLTADAFYDYGNGEVYLMTDTGTANLDTDRVVIDKGDISKIVKLQSSSDSDFILVEVTRGANVYLGYFSGTQGTIIGTLWAVPRFYDSDVTINITADTTITTCYQGGGHILLDAEPNGSITNFHLANGLFEQYSGTPVTTTQHGGVFKVVTDYGASNLTITTFNGVVGYFDSRDGLTKPTITTLNKSPQWFREVDPGLVPGTTNYIGGR